MGTEFTSLEDLFPRMRVYDGRMPVRMPGGLRRNVWLTLVIEFALLGLFVVLPHEFWQARIPQNGFFQLVPLVDLGNFVLDHAYLVVPYLMGVNLVSLLLALVSVTISFGMRRRVRPVFPLLTTINLIPAGVSLVLAVLVATVLVVVVAVHAALWCIGVLTNVVMMMGVLVVLLRLLDRR